MDAGVIALIIIGIVAVVLILSVIAASIPFDHR
jgi:hypothetical protein